MAGLPRGEVAWANGWARRTGQDFLRRRHHRDDQSCDQAANRDADPHGATAVRVWTYLGAHPRPVPAPLSARGSATPSPTLTAAETVYVFERSGTTEGLQARHTPNVAEGQQSAVVAVTVLFDWCLPCWLPRDDAHVVDDSHQEEEEKSEPDAESEREPDGRSTEDGDKRGPNGNGDRERSHQDGS